MNATIQKFLRSVTAACHRVTELGDLTENELELMGSDPADVLLLINTRSRVDVGSWFGKRRLRACLLPDTLLLLADGKQPYLQRIPLCELQDSLYNHVTGELVPGPARDDLPMRGIKMSPFDGSRVLDLIAKGTAT